MPDIRNPKTIAEASFSSSFRGYDQLEVRAFLQTLSRQLRDLDDLRAEADALVAEAKRELEAAQLVDEEVLAAKLGEDAVRILQTARDSATERLEAAETDAAELRATAEQEATELRSKADQDVAEVRAKADEDAEVIRRAAQDEADGLLADLTTRQSELDALVESEKNLVDEQRQAAFAQAQEEADEIRALARVESEKLVAEARHEGRMMVAEAKLVRERILTDLSRRRTNAKVQLEQLRAGRERLLEAIKAASTSVEEVNRDLDYSLPAARRAAEAAGRTVSAAAPVEELEREIQTARLVGAPIVSDDDVKAVVGPSPTEMAAAVVAEAHGVVVGDDEVDKPFDIESQPEPEPAPDLEAEVEPEIPDAPADPAESAAESDPQDEPPNDTADDGAGDDDADGLVLSEIGKDGRGGVFRRSKPLPPEAQGLPKEPVPTVDIAAEFEEVRVLDPTVELEVVSATNAAAAIVDLDPSLDQPDQAVENEPVELEPTDEASVETEAESEIDEPAGDPAKHETDEDETGEDETGKDGIDEGVDEPGEAQAEADAPEPHEVVAAEPEAEPETEAEADADAPEPEEAAAAESESETDAEVETEPEPEPEPEVEAATGGESDPDDSTVDDLFERLRADREKRVAQATTVLAGSAAAASVADAVDGDEPAPESPEPDDAPAKSTSKAKGKSKKSKAKTTDEPEAQKSQPAPELSRLQQAEQHVVARREALANVEKSTSKVLKRRLADEQNELLNLVRTNAADASIEAVAGDLSTHTGRYIEVALTKLQWAFTSGAGSLDASFDPAAAAQQAADEVFSDLREQVDKILAENDDPDVAIDLLRTLYREIKVQRMTNLASNLLVSAYNDGYYEQIDRAASVRWELAPDSQCGKACTSNVVAGSVEVGSTFPSGHLHPPATSGCRCLVIPESGS